MLKRGFPLPPTCPAAAVDQGLECPTH